MASLEPAGPDPDAPRPPEQVFDLSVPGTVTVGTANETADRHQTGTTRMPARPIVPPDGELPAAWEKELEAAGERAMTAVLEILLNNGGG
jgi:hypothetical protein